jgi:uncharacterized membrane protein YoaK (UPF0700 family)
MKQEIPPDDPRLIWQNQRRQNPSMSIEEVRLRAYAMQTKVHRNLIVTISVGFILLVFSALMIMRLPNTSPQVIVAVLMVFIVILINRAYKAFWAPDALPPDATSEACLAFYRRELTAQYRAVQPTVLRILPEIALFIVVLQISFMATFRFEHVHVFLPAFLALILFGRYWKARRLKRELHALTAFENVEN